MVQDCLGSGQVVPLHGAQQLVIDNFLFANDRELVRVFHPTSSLWETALSNPDAGVVNPLATPRSAVKRTINLWAMEGLIRLFARCSIGPLGVRLRNALVDDAGRG